MIAAVDFIVRNFVELVERGQTYVFLLPIYVVMLSGERVAHAFLSSRRWDNKDAAANLVITVIDLLRDLFFGHLLPVALVVVLYERARLVTLPPGGLGLFCAFVLYDLTWYVDHVIAHRTGFFWAFHSVHHSSKEYNFTVASRGFFLDAVLTRPLFYLLPILGVSPFQFIAVQILTNIFGIFQHTRLIGRLGLLDKILATPSAHRVHHGSDEKYIDKNYGEVLLIWDHLFGTHKAEEEEPTYGLTKNIDTYNPIAIEFAGVRWLIERIRGAERLSDKLRYLYMPPGWQHAPVTSK